MHSSEWPLRRLGELARVRRGASPRPIDDARWFADEGPGWIRIADVTCSDGLLTSTTQHLSQDGVKRTVPVHPGQVIMSICATVGRPIIVGMAACIHDGFVVFDQHQDRVDERFLVHHLRHMKRFFLSQGQTGTQANINTGIVNASPIRLPGIPEQRQIAAILDTIDDAIRKTEQIIVKLKQLKQGLLHDLLTCGIDDNGELRDPERHPEQFKNSPLGRIPREWEVARLLDLVSLPSGQLDPRIDPFCNWTLVAPDHVESRSGRLIKKETAREQGAISGKYGFQPGDIIYSKIRPYLRKAILADFVGLCSADMYPLRPGDAVDACFLLALILSEHFSRFAERVSMRSGFPKINREELGEYMCAIPPRREQAALGECLAEHERCSTLEESNAAKLRLLRAGLMEDLLTGRVRVTKLLDRRHRLESPRSRATRG